jgi:hypothetical protein
MNLDKFMPLHGKFMNYDGDALADEVLCDKLHAMLLLCDDPRDIKNPENPDKPHYGYVSIQQSFIINLHGHIVGQVRKGDVLIMQIAWDRNVIITHDPIEQCTPIPYLLKDTENFTGLNGIWLPIFDTELIWRFVKRQKEKDKEYLHRLLREEQKYWK